MLGGARQGNVDDNAILGGRFINDTPSTPMNKFFVRKVGVFSQNKLRVETQGSLVGKVGLSCHDTRPLLGVSLLNIEVK